MKIENFKDLAKLIALCQKTGVEAIKIDGIEMAIKPKAPKAFRRVPSFDSISPDEQVKITVNDSIQSDELTEEQLMFYSAQGHNPLS